MKDINMSTKELEAKVVAELGNKFTAKELDFILDTSPIQGTVTGRSSGKAPELTELDKAKAVILKEFDEASAKSKPKPKSKYGPLRTVRQKQATRMTWFRYYIVKEFQGYYNLELPVNLRLKIAEVNNQINLLQHAIDREISFRKRETKALNKASKKI
tara:strand:- start:74 stop:547 length:474 start_codon:yes stop_codon:yes gene_type:complete